MLHQQRVFPSCLHKGQISMKRWKSCFSFWINEKQLAGDNLTEMIITEKAWVVYRDLQKQKSGPSMQVSCIDGPDFCFQQKSLSLVRAGSTILRSKLVCTVLWDIVKQPILLRRQPMNSWKSSFCYEGYVSQQVCSTAMTLLEENSQVDVHHCLEDTKPQAYER